MPTGLPEGSVQLFPGTKVVDVQGFTSYFAPLKLNLKSKLNEPAFETLSASKNILESRSPEKPE